MGTENIRLGTCTITLGSTDLGLTAGGVEVTVETNTYESNCDQFGETVVKEIVTGRNVTVSVPMVETTLDNLVRVMPGATMMVDQSDPGKRKVEVVTSVGSDLRDTAAKLVLKPIGATNDLENFTVPLANTPGGINFAYMLDQERIYQADFKGYPDDNGLLFVYGDESSNPA